jgi:pseudouridine kinase
MVQPALLSDFVARWVAGTSPAMTAAREVIVIGGANIDIKAKAAGDLIPGTSNPGAVSFAPGGVARNIAHNLARLEIPVALISAVASDAFGSNLIAETEAAGVDCSMVLRVPGPASSYVAILDARGEMAVAVNAMPAMDMLTPEVLAAHEQRLASADIILADCNLPQQSLGWLARFAGRLVIEPVSVVKAEKLRTLRSRNIFAITCNRLQAEHLSTLKISETGDALKAAAELHRQGFERVVITLGAAGAVASHDGRGLAHVEAFAKTPQDVTGAGDAAASGLIFGLMQGLDLIAAARLGQAAASLAVAATEAVSPDLTRARLLSLASSRRNGR